MSKTTPIVTTVTKTANKEKTLKEVDAALKATILDFCEEHYDDISPVIMDKIRRDKRKEVHARLDFRENPRKSRRMREGSQNSSLETLPVRYRNQSERPKMRDRLKDNDEDGGDKHGYHAHDRDRSRSMKRERESESPLSRVSESDTSDGGHWKTRAKRCKPVDEEDLSIPWTCEDVDPFTPRIRNFKSSQKIRMPNNVKTFDGTGDPEDHLKIFQAAAQQKKYVKDPIEIHNIKQRDGETIEEFMEHFKIKTRRIKGAPKCMRISRFMHGVNNPELTKCHNEHVSKTVEEMMTAITAFVRGETAAASKKKVHTP
nr:hypothetical protein [Tanacetum cinerariifolium]